MRARYAVLFSSVAGWGCTAPARQPAGTHTPSTTGNDRWCVVASHLHTHASDRYSHAPSIANIPWAYDPAGLRRIVDTFGADGVDAIIVTDHNAIDAHFDPILADRNTGPAAILGMEWTTKRGHALLIGFTAADRNDAVMPPPWRRLPSDDDFRSMVSSTHARGGLVVISHPRVPFRTWPDDTFGADAIEVWGLDHPFIGNDEARNWWQSLLAAGHRLVAFGGADFHVGAALRRHRQPLDLVRAVDCTADHIIEGIRRGYVQVVRDRSSPRVFLEAHSELAIAHAGDVSPGVGSVRVHVRVVDGRGAMLVLFDRDGERERIVLAASDVTIPVSLEPRRPDFLRAEIHDARGLAVISNPVYFR